MQHMIVELFIEELKHKKCLTKLQGDIVATGAMLASWPFDVNAAKQKIYSNNVKYPDIIMSSMAMQAFVPSPFYMSTEEYYKRYLYCQLFQMILKESFDAVAGRRMFA